ncbi:MAG: hypothetical protein U0176_07705 [Bacteroidia bacterium]
MYPNLSDGRFTVELRGMGLEPTEFASLNARAGGVLGGGEWGWKANINCGRWRLGFILLRLREGERRSTVKLVVE